MGSSLLPLGKAFIKGFACGRGVASEKHLQTLPLPTSKLEELKIIFS